MQTLATLSPETAQILAAFLEKAAIPSETRTIQEETGLEAAEILVAEEDFDRACEAADQWQGELMEAAKERTQRRCPKCHSPNLEHMEDVDYDKSITKISAVYHCQDCGQVIAT